MRKLLILILVLLIPMLSFGQLGSGSEFLRSGSVFLNTVDGVAEPEEPEPAVYTDDFESYSDGSLSGQGNWTNGLNAFAVGTVGEDKQIGSNTANSVTALIYNGNVENDQYAEITLDAVATGHFLGVAVRLSGSGATLCGYGYYVSSTTQRIFRIDNGVKTNLGTAGAATLSGTVTLRLEVSGTTLTAYLNGSVDTGVGTSGTASATEYASGKTGISGYHNSGGTYGDDWEGGDL